MSGKRNRKQRRETEPDDRTLWIASEPTIEGPYVVVFNAGERAWSLAPTEVFAYAQYCMAAASRADHDAAVIRQFMKLGLAAEESAHMVMNLRADRPDLDPGTQPLRFEPGVSSDGKFRGFIAIELDGEKIGQFTPVDAQEHATVLLGLTTTADLDTAFYQVLVGQIELGENVARNVVNDLSNFRTMK